MTTFWCDSCTRWQRLYPHGIPDNSAGKPCNSTEAQFQQYAHTHADHGEGLCVELLKGRWLCLESAGGTLLYTADKVCKIILACGVLHNIARDNGAIWCSDAARWIYARRAVASTAPSGGTGPHSSLLNCEVLCLVSRLFNTGNEQYITFSQIFYLCDTINQSINQFIYSQTI